MLVEIVVVGMGAGVSVGKDGGAGVRVEARRVPRQQHGETTKLGKTTH